MSNYTLIYDIINHFWIRVPSAKSLFYTFEFKSKGLGGNPPKSWNCEIPLKVEMWLKTSCKDESKLASIVTVVPFDNLTLIVVTYLFLSGLSIKF